MAKSMAKQRKPNAPPRGSKTAGRKGQHGLGQSHPHPVFLVRRRCDLTLSSIPSNAHLRWGLRPGRALGWPKRQDDGDAGVDKKPGDVTGFRPHFRPVIIASRWVGTYSSFKLQTSRFKVQGPRRSAPCRGCAAALDPGCGAERAREPAHRQTRSPY